MSRWNNASPRSGNCASASWVSSAARLNFGELARQQGSPAERVLLEQVEDSLALLQTFSLADLLLIRTVLDIITGGQELDLRRFAPDRAGSPLPAATIENDARRAGDCAPHPGNIIALQTDAELDDYTWRVAGCVGEFWTKMCRAHLFPDAKLDDHNCWTTASGLGKVCNW